MTVGAFHAGITFREAVVVVRLAGDITQKIAHGFVEVVIAAVGHLQLVLAARSLLGAVLRKAVALDVFPRTLLTAHKLVVVLDPQLQQDRGDLGCIGGALIRRLF